MSDECSNPKHGTIQGPPAMASIRRVVVTGMGLVTPLGVGRDVVLRRIFAGEGSAIHLEDPDYAGIPCRVAATVPGAGAEYGLDLEARFNPSELKAMSRATALALVAAEEALQDAGWLPQDPSEQQRTGVAIGTGMAPLDEIAAAGETLRSRGYSRVSPFFLPRILPNMAAGQVSIRFGLLGPNHCVSTACATGAHAVGDAFGLVVGGHADVMVCGGTEASVGPLGLAAFSRMRALSTGFNEAPERASRPFDARRDGFVMGEGAGVLVLEELEHAQRRGVRIYGEVLGYGLSGDGHHVTAPSADGLGAFLCMQAALGRAGMVPGAVGYVNAHATSTPLGDEAEVRAIKRLFGPHAAALAVSSTKGAVGHLLGAAGAVEAAITIAACQRAEVPPTVNLDCPGPGLDLNFVPNRKQRFPDVGPRRVALTNSFGFGGTNAALCVASL